MGSGKKILNSNKVKIISLFIFIALTSIDVLNFLNLGYQNKVISENKKAIVVLTGGSKRLEEGFQLLQKRMGNALFISGVNPIVTKKDLSIILNKNKEMVARISGSVDFEDEKFISWLNSIR